MDEIELFTGLAPLLRQRLVKQATPRSFSTGEPLFRQGERTRDLFLLQSGRVRVWRATEAGGAFTLAMVGRGGSVGTFAVIGEEPTPMSATAVTAATALAWPREDVRRLLAADPSFATALLNIVARRATGMVARLEEVAAVPVEQRLARMLLRTEIGGAVDDELPLSRQDLADLVFSTLPTVSRVMSRWRAAGLVDGGRGRVRLLDRRRLAAVATFPVAPHMI